MVFQAFPLAGNRSEARLSEFCPSLSESVRPAVDRPHSRLPPAATGDVASRPLHDLREILLAHDVKRVEDTSRYVHAVRSLKPRQPTVGGPTGAPARSPRQTKPPARLLKRKALLAVDVERRGPIGITAPDTFMPPSRQTTKRTTARRRSVHLFIDETGFDAKSRFAAVGCAILDRPTLAARRITKLHDDLLRDPFIGLHRKARADLQTNSFHYSSNHQDVRRRFIDLLAALTFEAYVCFVEKISQPFDNGAWYDKLFARLLFDRLRANRSSHILICYEQTDSRRQRRLMEMNHIVAACTEAVGADRGGNVISSTIRSAGKEEPCLAIPDYVCGVLRTYLEERHDASKTHPAAFLARLRPKLRLVHDYGNGEFYSRRNPLP